MNLPRQNSAKVAETQIINWFLEEGWEVYEPNIDLWGIDAVVRPGRKHADLKSDFLTVQIKHRRDDKDYPDYVYMPNGYRRLERVFDCLIIFFPCHLQGLIVPKERLDDIGSRVPSKWAKEFWFDVSSFDNCEQFREFIRRFKEIMNV